MMEQTAASLTKAINDDSCQPANRWASSSCSRSEMSSQSWPLSAVNQSPTWTSLHTCTAVRGQCRTEASAKASAKAGSPISEPSTPTTTGPFR